MEGYSVKIRETSKELSAKERIAIKDTSNAISLDAITAENGAITLEYSYHAVLDVHNEKSDNKDYTKIVVVDKGGTKYVTGSESFRTALSDIVDEMVDAGEGENIVIEVYRKESKNYKGKEFITASIV